MKQKFIDMVPKLMIPWVDGSTGTPWYFTTRQLMHIGNANLPLDTVVNKEGEIIYVYLTSEDVLEAMEQMKFKTSFTSDQHIALSLAWEVELLPSVIL